MSGVLGYQTCKKVCNFPGGAKFKVTAMVGPAEEAGEVLVAFEEVKDRGEIAKIAETTPLPYGVIDYYLLAGQLGLAR